MLVLLVIPDHRDAGRTGLGVAAAAIVLEASRSARGVPQVGLADFHTAFVAFAVVAFVATVLVTRLAPAAGAELSGHKAAHEAA